MTDPAAEAAFEKWLRDHPPGTANVHSAFVAGWEARSRSPIVPGTSWLDTTDPENPVMRTWDGEKWVRD